MSGRRAPHLQRRDGIYHLRMRVPDAIRSRLGLLEVRRSLATTDFRHARVLVARLAAQVTECFEVIRSATLNRDQAQCLVRACFARLAIEAEARGGYVAATSEPDLELAEQRGLSQERCSDLRAQLLSNRYDGAVSKLAEELGAQAGVTLVDLQSGYRLDLLSRTARALLEEQRLFQIRLTDRLTTYSPSDPLFAQGASSPSTPPLPVNGVGLTVADAIARYLAHGKAQWVAKTLAARTWQLRFFSEHVGSGFSLSGVTEDHVRTFRDAVRRLHKRHGKMKGASFQQRQTDNAAHRISDKTASVTYEPARAFFHWASDVDGLLASNPAAKVRIVGKKRPKGEKSRRNFTGHELRVMFTAPIFTGCRSLHRRYEAGPHIIKDAKFWIPVLGYYCGLRLGEIVQLHVRDVCLEGSIPYLSINEENGSGIELGDRKHVKSHAGVRKVPLHPDVLSLGFQSFVASRSKRTGKGRVRLFHDFTYGSDHQASTVASKWFARFMHSVGLTDPKIVFHSLRHNAEDALRDAQVPKYVIDRIIGHSDTSASAAYGEGASIEVLYQAVKAMKLKVRLPELFAGT